MELFASPMACSLASHITALEAGLPVKVRFVENKKTDDGSDYYKISAKGYVPALRLDDGQVLNEGPSVLQYLADARPSRPGAGLGHRRALPAHRHAELPLDRAAQAHLLQCVQPQRGRTDQGAARALFEPTFDYSPGAWAAATTSWATASPWPTPTW